MKSPALCARVIVLLAVAAAAWTASISPASARAVTLSKEETEQLLILVSNPAFGGMREITGMTPEAMRKVAAHVGSGKRFGSVEEFRQVSGISDAQFDKLALRVREMVRLAKEEEAEVARALEQPPEPAATKAAGPAGRKGTIGTAAREGVPAPGTTSGLNLEVIPNYYSVLPGYVLTSVPEDKRRAFLDRINNEMCTCGCKDHTLAACFVNDPGCPIAKARIKKIYTDIFGAPPPAPASTPEPGGKKP